MLFERCKFTIHDSPQDHPSATPQISSEELQSLLRSPHAFFPHSYRIPEALENIDADIYRYDSQIRRLHSELAILQNERTHAQNQQEAYRSLLAPVRRVPTEILQEIFAFFGGEVPNRLTVNRVSFPGLSLMAVCTRWRNVAGSCPSLWSYIFLRADAFDTDDISDLEALCRPLKWCLDQAGPTVPLDIVFEGTTEQDGEIEVLKLFVAQARRWRHAHFFTTGLLTDFQNLGVLSETNLSSLESLYVMQSLEYYQPDIQLFQKAGRKLTKLSFSAIEDSNAVNAIIPLSQIKDLHLEDVSFDSGLLHACPHLQKVSYMLHPRDGEDLTFPEQTSQIVPSLKIAADITSRHHSEDCADSFGAFLDSAIFPAVKWLHLAFRGVNECEWHQFNTLKFTEFLQRSKCSLTFLHIESAMISDDDLIMVLIHTPELRHFTFHQNHEEHKVRMNALQLEWVSPTMVFIKRLHACNGIDSTPRD
ncbi:hypothetical protein BT96DRAFT_708554 [Gymnopus androsaceus JB14]|uniref:Uncharacterized protein n=1 Tax=Gymnopus androsaceus JB14 TaxID=1447944 RepID=A0A6A4HL31_9AGAR|nr:hypothetical protein BT96DRAFT_708554 [Gymnopus androsaceus JB14]